VRLRTRGTVHTHQVIVPFAPVLAAAGHTIARPASRERPCPPALPRPARSGCTSSCSPAPQTADQVLSRTARAVGSSLQAGGADQWFFIRYADPGWHLRLRVHGAPDRLLHETLPPAAPRHGTAAWRPASSGASKLDTYEREVERYGGEAGIGLAERVFHADSDAVLAIAGQLTGDAGAELRWAGWPCAASTCCSTTSA